MIDSRAAGPPTTSRPFADLTTGFDDAGALTVGGEPASYRAVESSEDNDNRWFALVSAPPRGAAWAGLGGFSGLVAGGALGLLVLSTAAAQSSHRRLHRAASTDALTHLANRSTFLDLAGDALDDARRNRTLTAVAVLDLDRFKQVNDTLGHFQGDELLKQVGPRITTALRSRDVLARIGGDEFALLLHDITDEAAARSIAERIIEALHEPFLLDGTHVGIEASIGIAISPTHGSQVEDLLRQADLAMYVAKENHTGVRVFDDDRCPDDRQPSLLHDLRAALQHGDLVLHYQPIVDVTSGRVRGVEALMRWQHVSRGLLPPAAFIPEAEQSALIRPLTAYAIRAALAQCRIWLDAGHEVPVSVNVSPRCLIGGGLVEDVRAALQSAELPPGLLTLEVLESALVIDPEGARSTLTALRMLGVRIAIDDFGAGYSSYSHLRDLPVDALKIDRSFVKGMASDPRNKMIVRSVICLGQDLGLDVVAEGVEDADCLDHVRAAGCRTAQGFHWSQALPAEQILPLLESSLPRAG